jgi:glycerophosphoryl diester phosphodiesterase
MRPGELKTMLMQCLEKDAHFFTTHPFSVAHRGACLQFPEHTAEAYKAAMTMGAGVVECDVAVTSDGELVCRHSQCDLHTTTNILATPLAAKCSAPFMPAANGSSASANCCTSDITLAEYKTLCGKMDASVSTATTVRE